jgi:hypothetical protein
VYARRFARSASPGWAVLSAVCGACTFVGFLLNAVGVSQTPGLADYVGVSERIVIVAGLGWLTALALYLRRTPGPGVD